MDDLRSGLKPPPSVGRILWAEDESTDRYLIRTSLDDLPNRPEVDFVEDGQELLEALSRALPARVVLDLNMPRMSGQEALKRLRSDLALTDLPVSVFTGVDNPQMEAECRKLGVSTYVAKPVGLPAYSEGVRKVLGLQTNL